MKDLLTTKPTSENFLAAPLLRFTLVTSLVLNFATPSQACDRGDARCGDTIKTVEELQLKPGEIYHGIWNGKEYVNMVLIDPRTVINIGEITQSNIETIASSVRLPKSLNQRINGKQFQVLEMLITTRQYGTDISQPTAYFKFGVKGTDMTFSLGAEVICGGGRIDVLDNIKRQMKLVGGRDNTKLSIPWEILKKEDKIAMCF